MPAAEIPGASAHQNADLPPILPASANTLFPIFASVCREPRPGPVLLHETSYLLLHARLHVRAWVRACAHWSLPRWARLAEFAVISRCWPGRSYRPLSVTRRTAGKFHGRPQVVIRCQLLTHLFLIRRRFPAHVVNFGFWPQVHLRIAMAFQ